MGATCGYATQTIGLLKQYGLRGRLVYRISSTMVKCPRDFLEERERDCGNSDFKAGFGKVRRSIRLRKIWRREIVASLKGYCLDVSACLAAFDVLEGCCEDYPHACLS